MQRALIFIIPIFLSYSSVAQSSIETKDNEREFNQFKSLYKTAQSYRDTGTMLTGLVGMLSIKPKDTTSLKMLAQLYAAHQNYRSAVSVCKKYTDIVPDDIEMLQLYATCDQNASNFEYALLLYTELYYRTKRAEYKYFAAYMEYELFRQEDCLKTINYCLQIPSMESEFVTVNSADGKSQSVPLKAVCLNLMGLAYLDMQLPDKAKDAFRQSLALFPDYTVAHQNLNEAIKRFGAQ